MDDFMCGVCGGPVVSWVSMIPPRQRHYCCRRCGSRKVVQDDRIVSVIEMDMVPETPQTGLITPEERAARKARKARNAKKNATKKKGKLPHGEEDMPDDSEEESPDDD